MKERIIVGTRGSRLALWQANFIATELRRHYGGEIELKVIKTTGDKIADSPLAKIGDKGLFVKEIEKALLDNSVDLAVHSMKDMPTEVPQGLRLAGVSKREDPRDVFISPKFNRLDELKEGNTVATSSLRRKAQLLNYKPYLKITDIRGNVDTRVRKLEEGHADALIMAYAGLKRMRLEQHVRHFIDQDIILPAVGQGCIAVEVRKEDSEIKDLVSSISCKEDFQAVLAERALMRTLEGGCQVPIGALASVEKDLINIKAMVSSLDGSILLRDIKSGNIEQAENLGIELAQSLLEKGADKILAKIKEENVKDTRNSQI